MHSYHHKIKKDKNIYVLFLIIHLCLASHYFICTVKAFFYVNSGIQWHQKSVRLISLKPLRKMFLSEKSLQTVQHTIISIFAF